MIIQQKNKPLISIIIPTFNRGHIIGDTLDSILAQTHVNWECLVVDDGSTDDTESVLLKYSQKDERISYHKRPKTYNKGSSGCRNYGYSICQGQFINWFDSDDVMLPQKLKTDLKALNSGEYDFTISQSDFFNDSDATLERTLWNIKLWSDDPINDFILLDIGWGLNSPLWKREALERTQLRFDENIITATDYLYHIEALTKNLKPVLIDQVLVSQRRHDNQMANHHLKAPSKLYVNCFLFINKEKFNLNTVTTDFLKQQFKIQFSSLLKMKQLGVALKYLIKFQGFDLSPKTKLWFLRKTVFGIWFKLSSKGYDLIDY